MRLGLRMALTNVFGNMAEASKLGGLWLQTRIAVQDPSSFLDILLAQAIKDEAINDLIGHQSTILQVGLGLEALWRPSHDGIA